MNRLKDLREDRDMKQVEVGKLLGMSKSSISYYESSERDLSASLINKFCDFYNVTADYLLGRSNQPQAKWSKMDTDLLLAYHAAPLEIQKIINSALEAYMPAEAEDKKGAASAS